LRLLGNLEYRNKRKKNHRNEWSTFHASRLGTDHRQKGERVQERDLRSRDLNKEKETDFCPTSMKVTTLLPFTMLVQALMCVCQTTKKGGIRIWGEKRARLAEKINASPRSKSLEFLKAGKLGKVHPAGKRGKWVTWKQHDVPNTLKELRPLTSRSIANIKFRPGRHRRRRKGCSYSTPTFTPFTMTNRNYHGKGRGDRKKPIPCKKCWDFMKKRYTLTRQTRNCI